MTQEKDHARHPSQPAPERKPQDLPGPNRQAEITRVGEALAPGTVPDEERQERERRGQQVPGSDRP
jgi:hypothetical protein